ncbi:unnamed protein product [marine sediment metagenome]|uniref:Uncharacterized protein n=1 Tax=marine sediment metagenome TaxID=412755 RepID=X0Y7J8_9ZZZZ
MPDKLNGWQGKLLGAALGLAVLGIVGGVAVYANQGRIEERVANVEEDADACCTEAGEATKALIRLETRFDGLEKNQDMILQKLDKLIEKK